MRPLVLAMDDAPMKKAAQQDAGEAWQPMETAPKDMRCILVFVPGSRIGDFQEEADMIHVAFLKRDSYRLQDEDHFIVTPSHWMPLPDNPTQYRPKARNRT